MSPVFPAPSSPVGLLNIARPVIETLVPPKTPKTAHSSSPYPGRLGIPMKLVI